MPAGKAPAINKKPGNTLGVPGFQSAEPIAACRLRSPLKGRKLFQQKREA
jgi:hypothetical protein